MLGQDRHTGRQGIACRRGKALGRPGPGCSGGIYSSGGEVVSAVRQQAGDGLGEETVLDPQVKVRWPESNVCPSIERPIIHGDHGCIASCKSNVAVQGGGSGLNVSSRQIDQRSNAEWRGGGREGGGGPNWSGGTCGGGGEIIASVRRQVRNTLRKQPALEANGYAVGPGGNIGAAISRAIEKCHHRSIVSSAENPTAQRGRCRQHIARRGVGDSGNAGDEDANARQLVI